MREDPVPVLAADERIQVRPAGDAAISIDAFAGSRTDEDDEFARGIRGKADLLLTLGAAADTECGLVPLSTTVSPRRYQNANPLSAVPFSSKFAPGTARAGRGTRT